MCKAHFGNRIVSNDKFLISIYNKKVETTICPLFNGYTGCPKKHDSW